MAIQRRALVLNQNYEPLNVCSVKRAVVLVFRGKIGCGSGAVLSGGVAGVVSGSGRGLVM